jgi:hypothetical protein
MLTNHKVIKNTIIHSFERRLFDASLLLFFLLLFYYYYFFFNFFCKMGFIKKI